MTRWVPSPAHEKSSSIESDGASSRSSKIKNDSSLKSRPSFEFQNVNSARIFDHLTNAFDNDFMTKRFARDDSGWRTLGEIANEIRISTSIVYSKRKNQLSPPIQELLQRGLIERRFFQNERGRGGEVMRFRITYDNELVRSIVDEKIKRGSVVGSRRSVASDEKSAVTRSLNQVKQRIAVLPLVNISQDASDEYFADGMTEELISTFSKISGFEVISRTSMMRFKHSSKSLSEIADELNVNVVLEGSVRKVAEDLRISVQLIGVEKDEHLWSEDYDRKFKNIFALQKEIALRVADSLQVTILSKESKELEKKPTQNMEAYILYLKGCTYCNQFTLESFKKAIDYFEQAIEKDPNYAQAYAWIASIHSTTGGNGMLATDEAFPKAEEFAEKAMQLDPSIPESHLALADVLVSQKWDFLGAEMEIRRALQLNPNLVICHLSLADLLLTLGRFEEAVVESKRALELDPLSTFTCAAAGSVLGASHHDDEAIEVLRHAIQLEPNLARAHDNLGTAYVMKGMIEEGLSEIKIGVEISKRKVANFVSDLAWAYAKAGKIEEVRNILAELLKTNEQDRKLETEIAGVYVSLGEKDKAMEWLEKAYERHAGYLIGINFDSSFDDIRSEPRFQALRKKIGFPEIGKVTSEIMPTKLEQFN